MEEEAKKAYEIAFLIRAEEAISDVLGVLKHKGGEIDFEGALRQIALAYPVEKETQAFLGHCHFRLAPERLAPLSHALRIHKQVLRFLVVTPPFLKNAATVVSRQRQKISLREPFLQKKAVLPLSNEDIEKKIGEILQ